MSQMPEDEGRRSRRALPRIASPRTPPSAAAHHSERPFSAATIATQDDRRREHLVEDLAVQMDVVPDEVRVERGQQGTAERDALRGDAPADRVDEPGRDDRHGDVRRSDGHPRAIDPVDRDEEEAVERLRVGGRNARDEAVRAVLEEDEREVVALVRIGGEDVLALVQQRGESRQPGGDRERDVGMAIQSAQGESGTVRGRLLPR